MTGSRLRYAALGDSYTIGTGVEPHERWPNQLVAALAGRSPGLELVANLAVNGHTSGDVVARQLPALDPLRPEFASLLVGVNDVVQGVPDARFQANVAAILDDLLGRLPPERVVAVSIPDYTVTPRGSDYGDAALRAAGIRRHNATLLELAASRSIAWIDVHDLSLLAADDRTLVAGDGLHPSGVQYARWVERIGPVVKELLDR